MMWKYFTADNTTIYINVLPEIIDKYNHTCRKWLTKKQVAKIFIHQNVLASAKLSPLQAIDEFNGIRDGSVNANFYNDCTMMPNPADLSVKEKNLLILDDCFLGKQSKGEGYFTRGRNNNCDTFYILQDYFRLPHQTIRENANLIISFPQDAKDHIHTDHCNDDMSIDEFNKFCRNVWSAAKHNFVTIDLTSGKLNGKYRKNLDCFYLPRVHKESRA